MKIVFLSLFASLTVFAADQNINCIVPIEGKAPVIKVNIQSQEESAGDFVMLTITEPNKSLVYYTQMEKGAFQQLLDQGQIVTMMVSEEASMENGALHGAGLLVLSKEGNVIQGFATLNNTFYPIACQ